MVVAGCVNGHPGPGTDDVLAFANRLRDLQDGIVWVLLLGDDTAGAAEEIARRTGFDVTALSGLSDYTNEAYRIILAEQIKSAAPAVVCTAHNSQGAEWAPCVAANIGADCISAVDGIAMVNGQICFQKDICGGKLKGRYVSATPAAVITVQPGSFKFEAQNPAHPGTVTLKQITCRLKHTQYLGLTASGADTANITQAEIIVAAGNGIGSEENLELIYRLADLFSKAAVGGTRIVCDRGWLGYHQQIGVTGATVAPALYIACGISGAAQHRAGMRGSGFVIAINTDPYAPMFNDADVCIAEDLTQFIPLVLDTYKRIKDSTDAVF